MFRALRLRQYSRTLLLLRPGDSACRWAAVRAGGHGPCRLIVSDASPSGARGRAKKGKETIVQLDTLTQGLIPGEPAHHEEEEEFKYPAVLQQVRSNIQKFDQCVVLTRVGNFYELYFEQATDMGPLLQIKVTDRAFGPRATPILVPMAGFPFFQLDRYLKILVQDHGKHVAISEEVELDPSERVNHGGRQFDRQVKRIITPGTLIDENFLSPYEPNYVLAIDVGVDAVQASPQRGDGDSSLQVGLSWLELSSGSFFTQSTDLGSLASALTRVNPREIVLDPSKKELLQSNCPELASRDANLISYFVPSEPLSVAEWEPMLERKLPPEDAIAFTPEEVSSTSLLLQYVKSQVPGVQMRLQSPVRQQATNFMRIDKNSLRGLEVLQTLRDGAYKGSLLQAVRRTSTESGARLLAQRLTSPSFSLVVINDRLDLVDVLVNDNVLLEELMLLLRRTYDTFRLVQKFSLGRGDADDLLALAKTINVTRSIGEVLQRARSNGPGFLLKLLNRFDWDRPQQLAAQILEAINEEELTRRQRNEEADASEAAGQARTVIEEEAATGDLEQLHKRLNSKQFTKSQRSEEKLTEDETWIMSRNASPTLERLHEGLDNLQAEKIDLAQSLRTQLRATTLTLKMTPGLGYICHVKGKDARTEPSVLGNVRTVSSSKSTRSFYHPDWTRLGNRIEESKARIRKEELNVFKHLREQVIRNLVVLRRNAAALDDLDVSCSFARLATEYNLKRPNLNSSTDLRIWQGRHIMVENGLAGDGRNFMPNDCFLEGKEKIWLITGPNMAGKSTFLRQTALISILAQTGSFVPAEYAEIGIVDQIFSRVGSADNLSQDQSTFMVEMLETAHILRHASSQSFVIMDEVGRGTTPEDGIAVGYAVLHYLQHVNRCRTLFATHFHALADMTKDFEGLTCFCTDVVEEAGGSFRYDHRLRRGVNRESHALKVAKLAGMPNDAIKLAAQVLDGLKPANQIEGNGGTVTAADPNSALRTAANG